MDKLTVIIALGLLLVAIGISGRKYSPWAILVGLGVIGFSIVSRLLAGGSFLAVSIELFRDAGLALVLAALWLVARKPQPGARPFFLLGVLSLALAGVLYVGSRAIGAFMQGEAVSVLVELGPDDHVGEIAPVLERFGAAAEQAFPTIDLAVDEDLAQVLLVRVNKRKASRLMAALRADAENVDFVEVNALVELPPVAEGRAAIGAERSYLENDPRVSEQWALESIRGHEAHALLRDMQPIRKARVAILDTGVQGDHEDLTSVLSTTGASDVHGHGTHCAGIAGAATNNGLGVASLNWDGRFIALQSFEALGDAGRGTLEQIAQAIIDATQSEVDVISMSLGSVAPVQPRVLVTAIGFALRNDVIVAASAGNNNEDAANHFPSNIEGVIAVAAVDQNLDKAKFSNTIAGLSRPLAAPGVDILSAYVDGDYKLLSGTSMATPVVTGLLGIMRSIHPSLTAADAYGILHDTGTEVEATPMVGRVINAETAIRATLAR